MMFFGMELMFGERMLWLQGSFLIPWSEKIIQQLLKGHDED